MAPQETSHLDRALALRETIQWIFGIGDQVSRQLERVLKRAAPEDIAAILGDFEPEEKLAIFRAAASTEHQGVILEETDPQSRRTILEVLDQAEKKSVLGDMPVDDLVDLLEELPVDERKRLIGTLAKDEAREVRELLKYESDTAGGMMTTEYLSVSTGTTSRDVLTTIQGNASAEVINYVYVTDPSGRLAGVVSIRDVLTAKPETLVDGYMERDLVTVRLETDREQVAAAVDKYNLSVLPVVDEQGAMRGVVTFDDVFDAVQEEHSEDMLRMAGTTAIHPFYEPVYVGALRRLPFLLVTMTGGFAVFLIQNRFRGLMDAQEKLFAVMVGLGPLLSGLSGNVAVVTSTVLVRGLATGEIDSGRLWKAVSRELLVGLLVGVVVALLGGALLSLLGGGDCAGFGTLRVASVVGIGLSLSLAWAALVGGLVPVVCHLTRVIDPAIASGPFVTMMCDISAWLIYLLLVYTLLGF